MHSYPLLDVNPGIRNIVIVDSIDSSSPDKQWPARSTELPSGTSQSGQTVLDIGYEPETELGLRPVPDGMTEAEWEEQQELDRLLEREALLQSAPQIRFGNGGWTFRHANGMLEPLRDLLPLQQSVHLAVSRGLGAAAIEPVQHPAEHAMWQAESMGN
jgi:hypothetical protein